MKFRIKENSLRIRLTKTDVKRLYAGGFIKESILFFPNRLLIEVYSSLDLQLSSNFSNNCIKVGVPKEIVRELHVTDRIGAGNWDRDLYLLLEKDFQCLDDVAEDQSDNYPNPNREPVEET